MSLSEKDKTICIYHPISRIQRRTETEAGLGLEGTKGYEVMGCYKCNGMCELCLSYINRNMLTKYE